MVGESTRQPSIGAFALFAFVSIAGITPPLQATAQEIVSRGRGQLLAKQLCSECHATDIGDDASPLAEAPTFPTVAATPGMTPLALTAILSTSHRSMPNILLSPEDQANLVTYILSLK